MFNKIESFYKVIPDEHGNLFIENGKRKLIPRTADYFYFVFGNQCKTKDEAEKLCEEGKALKITGEQLYKHYFNWTDDELYMNFYGYDLKTKEFLKEIRDSLGFIREDHGWDEEKLIDSPRKIKCWDNVNEVEIGRNDKGEWCAQFAVQTAIDDYDIVKYFFLNEPSRDDIITLDFISRIEFKFFMRHIKPTFVCWECGVETHWLDIKGDIFKKYEALEDRYCGC
jgi:hypothetical protein